MLAEKICLTGSRRSGRIKGYELLARRVKAFERLLVRLPILDSIASDLVDKAVAVPADRREGSVALIDVGELIVVGSVDEVEFRVAARRAHGEQRQIFPVGRSEQHGVVRVFVARAGQHGLAAAAVEVGFDDVDLAAQVGEKVNLPDWRELERVGRIGDGRDMNGRRERVEAAAAERGRGS